VKIFKYPIIGPYTPLRTPRRTCRYLSGPEILEVRNYLLQYSAINERARDEPEVGAEAIQGAARYPGEAVKQVFAVDEV
jgi:hypothetical protein